MPFKSEAQRRLFHVMADRGEISEKKVKEWEHKTKNKKELPMHVKKEASYVAAGRKAAMLAFGLEKQAEMPHWALPVAKHVAGGAIPAAALAYMASGKNPETGEDHALRNALLAGAVGGLGGAGVDAMTRASDLRSAQNKLLLKALKDGTWAPKRIKHVAGGRPDAEMIAFKARRALDEKMPLYATPEEWAATTIGKRDLVRPTLGGPKPGIYDRELKALKRELSR